MLPDMGEAETSILGVFSSQEKASDLIEKVQKNYPKYMHNLFTCEEYELDEQT
jgi:hypothetical protein